MTVKPHPQSEAAKASRLDDEPMARRDFLGKAALSSAASAMFLAALGIARLPRAAVLPSPSKKFRVTLPASMAEGAAFIPPGRSVAIVRDAEGLYAISTVCTHLGCIVKRTQEGFECPCHGSRFGGDGQVVRGPAPKALSWLALQDTGGGTIMIDEGKVVAAGTKVNVA
jgi:nitrite reductase/ring-hydroxylating ferredoxin subunit